LQQSSLSRLQPIHFVVIEGLLLGCVEGGDGGLMLLLVPGDCAVHVQLALQALVPCCGAGGVLPLLLPGLGCGEGKVHAALLPIPGCGVGEMQPALLFVPTCGDVEGGHVWLFVV
jgi:hypothetical protein